MKKEKRTEKKKGSAFVSVILFMVFFAGLFLVVYPTLADYINKLHTTAAIGDYTKKVDLIKEEEYRQILEEAEAYNSELAKRDGSNLYETDPERYRNALDITGDGIMGYIEIPAIGVSLPIYHGTSEQVLQLGVGHVEWSSLPVGGKSSHTVLSGHRGLPSAKLFTDIDDLVAGDVFVLRVLNEVFTYEVDQILTVLPTNTNDLQIEAGEDYCTLLTCTPYGVNTHRLLVRGHRITNTEEAETIWITAEAMQIEPVIVASVISIPFLMLLVIIVFVRSMIAKRRLRARNRIKKMKKLK